MDATQISSLGGLAHSINAALAFCGSDDRLIPFSRVGIDVYPDLQKMWPDDPRLVRDAFIPYNQLNNCVELSYIDANERIEKSLNPMPPLLFEEVEPFLDVDVVLVNLISGWDVELEFMVKLRNVFRGLIGIDIHSLTLERLPDGTRRLQAIENIKSWFDSADLIQFNEREYDMIVPINTKPEVFFMQTCAQMGKIFNLTKGARGSASYQIKNDHYEIINTYPDHNIKVIDPIGCGDAFLAAFGISYAKTGDMSFAARQANIAAGLAGSTKGLADPTQLQQRLNAYTKEDR